MEQKGGVAQLRASIANGANLPGPCNLQSILEDLHRECKSSFPNLARSPSLCGTSEFYYGFEKLFIHSPPAKGDTSTVNEKSPAFGTGLFDSVGAVFSTTIKAFRMRQELSAR